MRTVLRLLLVMTVFFAYPAVGRAAPDPLWDLLDHWAEREIYEAVVQGWVNGYPDGSFQPEATITTAEFLKMLSAATGMAPGGEAVQFLTEASRTYRSQGIPTHFDSHWFATQGWLETALAGGLIHAKEGPYVQLDRPITRQEIATFVVRALGIRMEPNIAPPPFMDWEQIDPQARADVRRAAELGILAGYADSTFGPQRSATRAEAVTVVGRALNWMTQGIDPQIMVFVRRPSFLHPNDIPQPLSLPVPVQEIDGVLYVAARSLFGSAASRLYPDETVSFEWDPVRQTLIFEYGVPHNFQAGGTSSLFPPYQEHSPPRLPAATRLLYGEVMIPVYSPTEKVPLWVEDPVWEPQAKILIISLHEPSFLSGENVTWPA